MPTAVSVGSCVFVAEIRKRDERERSGVEFMGIRVSSSVGEEGIGCVCVSFGMSLQIRR
ncbi:hypothetical protein Hanom_Chr04g00367241 [Helianthus anomalus]